MQIDTSDECVNKMLHALPFADNEAGLDETAQLIRRLKAELDGERNARHVAEKCLRNKDEAMGELFKRLDAAGVDYSDLIS